MGEGRFQRPGHGTLWVEYTGLPIQPGRMGQQHPDGDLALFALLPFREEIGDRLIQRLDSSFGEQEPDSEADDGLGGRHGLNFAVNGALRDDHFAVAQDDDGIRVLLLGAGQELIESGGGDPFEL